MTNDKFEPCYLQVAELMGSKEIGISEAKAILRKENLIEAIEKCSTIDEMKEIILSIVENGTPQ